MKPYLSVVIPCYNEEQNIRLGSLDKLAHYMEKQKYSWEVLIVDDGSNDKSRELIKKLIKQNDNFRLIENTHQGKAGTVIKGMLEAVGEIVLFSDLDQSAPIEEVEKLLPWLEKEFDIVIGSRKDRREGAPLSRKIMGPGFMLARSIILGMKDIDDTQCGFKAFRTDVARDVFSALKLYKPKGETTGARVTAGFDVEVLYLAQQRGYRIKEVPVEWHYVDTRRVSPISDSIDALIDIFRIKINSVRNLYTKN